MAPKLRVLVSSATAYPPSSPITVNSTSPTPIKTDHFDGEISVYIKDYNGDHQGGDGSVYFSSKGRESMTYGIVVRGHFLEEINADDVVFGNVFEKSVKDHLPWGTSIATKFMYFVDPTLEIDIYADKPWALSPTLACMNYLSLGTSKPEGHVVEEDSLPELKILYEGSSSPPDAPSDEKSHVSARRKWLGNAENRKNTTITSDTQVGLEFCNGLLDFNTLSATLPQPFRLQVPLLKYWDGQPVTYVCQKRHEKGESPVGGDRVYFSVAFEIVDEEAKKALEKRGGKASDLAKDATETGEEHASTEAHVENDDDID
ncbi:hypothetical protein BCR39DRAFT_487597 [Naematelia encephala]|uniref:Domain of unknown function at the cortex 1 domain-containing protein n=1 Tax=Naematelia encephala TaxID=71784 RepID=A0A1Y2AKR1_9TREE|nr:hypothetical protein BCR39DRAFT_487597 [Naematelia encephala]